MRAGEQVQTGPGVAGSDLEEMRLDQEKLA